ncbi:beta-hexosaminidase subunit beta-like [Dysidea avara]|uniref:beta-hexosaminidase subunit beta-like n=1 Tax=Dysidea avara TaxID=196820 RepID=UPI003316A8B5
MRSYDVGVWLAVLFTAVTSDTINPVDYLWPIPYSVKCDPGLQYGIDDATFTFQGSGQGGELPTLTSAFERYRPFIVPDTMKAKNPNVKLGVDMLEMLEVNVVSNDETLALETDESYTLEFKNETTTGVYSAILTATTVYGALRGIETFSQLVHQDDTGAYYVSVCTISDKPRFHFRSILMDTARHFIPLEVIYRHLDVMAYDKFNVLHWHIVDDQSFPYQSYSFPDLSGKGAYAQNHVYSQSDVAAVIEYAKERGIRVIPEFDTPGHTASWGNGQPNLLTPCYKVNTTIVTGHGPINPILESTYTFLESFYKEISEVFPDQYLHLGGDEVSFTCWESNPDIKKWMAAKNLTKYAKLEEYYEQRLIDIVDKLGKSYLVWQEIFDNGVEIRNDTVISVWKGNKFQQEMERVTAAGYKVILSACWYLNHISYGKDWVKYYTCDPQNFNGTEAQKELVMGGGAALWAEFVDGTNLLSRLWPRASAVGEKLWSQMARTTNANSAAPRLHNHRCRLLRRGVPAEPIEGPSFCPEEYVPHY